MMTASASRMLASRCAWPDALTARAHSANQWSDLLRSYGTEGARRAGRYSRLIKPSRRQGEETLGLSDRCPDDSVAALVVVVKCGEG